VKRKAVITFSATLVVYPDEDEDYDGGEMTESDASGWVGFALARGDKHAGGYISYPGAVSSIAYEDFDEDD
jgi:hypothetical protein